MAKAKTADKKKAAPKATKAIKKVKPLPKKAAPAKGKKEVLAAPAAAPVLVKTSSKKEPVAPVKAPALSRSASKTAKSSNKTLDLCLLLDCTGSMSSWIQRSKDTLREIIDNVKADNPELDVRVCFVGYRDIQDKPRFSIHEFTTDLDKIKRFISGVNAMGGGDFPEDVQGGFHEALKQDWEENSVKMAFHIFDAPGHGKDICPDAGDSYPGGSPDGHKI